MASAAGVVTAPAITCTVLSVWSGASLPRMTRMDTTSPTAASRKRRLAQRGLAVGVSVPVDVEDHQP